MREVVFDTETTGTDPASGDRIVQIAAIELVNLIPTGREFDMLLDPGRESHPDAERVHGISRAMTLGKPSFAEAWPAFRDFVGDTPLVAHNAEFDFAFLEAECRLIGQPAPPRSRMVCSLALARSRFPGLPNSLDALCRRYAIDLSARVRHEALLDVKLLAQVYLELRGGRQPGLGLAMQSRVVMHAAYDRNAERAPRPITPDAEALARHAAAVGRIPDAIWQRMA
jgi:DNA polymerase-3 subunit epsilon